MKLTLKCSKCGSDQFEMPDRPRLSDKVTCARCGASTRYGDLKKQAGSQAEKLIADQLGKLFK